MNRVADFIEVIYITDEDYKNPAVYRPWVEPTSWDFEIEQLEAEDA